MKQTQPQINEVHDFWQENPVCKAAIDYDLGSSEYFTKFDALRERNEPLDFLYNLHEFLSFKGKKVLDIGCGNGYILSHYQKAGAICYGVDITEIGVELSKQRLAKEGGEGEILLANAEALPFEDNTFDCVCSMGVLHHTPNTQKAIDEAIRVLKPNGRFIMMFYHEKSILNKWNFTLLPFIHPRYLGMSRKALINAVDGMDNPKGDVYTKERLLEATKTLKHHYFFTHLVQKWMIWPIGYILPKKFLEFFACKWGWFLYVKAWK